MSYRNRGKVERIHTQKKAKITVEIVNVNGLISFNKTLDVRKDKNRIDAYSAIKINANPTAPYSVLNPDTSSDSPSAKSNGVRLVSATQEINHNITTGEQINTLETKEVSDHLINSVE